MLINYTTRPNFFVKARCITLISLFELKRADKTPSTEFIWIQSSWKVIKYWIHIIGSRSLAFTKIVFLLSLVMDVKVA